MNEESACIVSTTSRCINVTKEYKDNFYAAERVVVKSVANLEDLEDGESLVLIKDESTEDVGLSDSFYKYLTIAVYVLAIIVIFLCFLSDYFIE